MPDIWVILYIVTKFMLYFGVLTCSGAVLFRMLFRELHLSAVRSARPTILWSGLLGLLAGWVNYGLQGAHWGGDVSGILWETSFGAAFLFRVAGLALIVASLLFPRGGRFLALIGVALALWSFGEIGLALNFENPWFTMLLAVYFGAISFWIGALGPLYHLSNKLKNIDGIADLAHRFGNIAVVVAPVLFGAAAVFALYPTGPVTGLIGVPYGVTVLAIVAGTAVLLGTAVWDVMRHVLAIQNGTVRGLKNLQMSIIVQLGGISVVILMASVMPILFRDL